MESTEVNIRDHLERAAPTPESSGCRSCECHLTMRAERDTKSHDVVD